MKIGIMGDTHGDLDALEQVVKAAGSVEAWIHTGDYSQDAKTLESLSHVPVYAVCGNCDMYEGRAAMEKIVHLEGHTIWITHGNKYLRYDDEPILAQVGQEKKADIVVYGHTHLPVVKWYAKELVVNPGSPSRPRLGIPTYATLTIAENTLPVAEICKL